MIDTLPKLKTKKELRTPKKSKLIEDTFIKACEQLDASLLEPFVEEEAYFEDLDKFRFLAKLKKTFDEVKVKGFTNTKLVLGKCRGCQRGVLSNEFHSKKGFEFAYLVLKDENSVTDIFQCYLSSTYLDILDEKIRKEEEHVCSEETFDHMQQLNPNLGLFKEKFDLDI